MIDSIKLIEYNIWANRRILEQIQIFSQEAFTKEIGGSFPSIHLTLLHLLESDWIWFNRWKGLPYLLPPTDWNTSTAKSIAQLWLPIQEESRLLMAESLKNENADIHFTTKRGASFTMKVADVAIHITNHGTYHRGQIVNMIRILGETPVNTDYFIYCTL